MRNFRVAFWIAVVAVYVGGGIYFNDKVREACTHAGCIHGWYSKYTGPQKFVATAWLLGMPVVSAGIYWLMFVKIPKVMRRRRANQLLRIVK